jgi:uncharacterized membrane-anchored protein YitT (DUF2179 family)
MTALTSKPKKPLLFLIVSAIFVAIGLASFVVGYGLSDGWDVVAAWFSSQDALLLYIILGCYFLIIIFWLVWEKVKKL